eukprot:CAMPEP_0201566382 /NCGR_PEP_ID=MMETSP0190_2-20130828/6128_1 /ASSEMBLY_ACC=CAM_ASM_000263 /TAXON_ID=37353 /ORGANISM="Rosalina sp." /LENGTH=97 /DNA_ID=CAMNT_0047985015 /DNA_START=84 /DNA_END=374 /DNA_ORIENTATION=+
MALSFGTFNNNNNTNKNNSMNKSASNNKPTYNPNNDVILNDPPNDSIQALKWSPKANLLAVASWDCTVRAYQVDGSNGSSTVIGEYKNTAPPLDVIW